ncbi:MAG: SPFH domain-containing protein [Catenulispora sp.]|nr:SPFH domain-containing protein [Catenulispora sp.]
MADISRRFFLRHLRSTPTTWIRHHAKGRVKREGVGLSFWYRPLTAVLSEVPVDDRELPLLFHARSADFSDITVQATVTYRVAEPATAASRLDFSIHPSTGVAASRPLDQVATLLAELAQQPALDLLARLPLAEALTAGISPVREAVSAALAEDARLSDLGVRVVSARVVAIRPEPELERALQTPTRETVQADADRATYARRAQAVEQERAIAENELQNKIELARREQQLVEQHGANARRQAELDAAAQLAEAQGQAEREKLATSGQAEREKLLADARAAAVRAVGLAEAEKEAARIAAYRDLPEAVLQSLTVREFAGKLPEIKALTITPDVVTDLLQRLVPGSGEAQRRTKSS